MEILINNLQIHSYKNATIRIDMLIFLWKKLF